MPKVNYKKNNFDIDLDFGEKGEDWVVNLFEGNSKVEVKTERGLWQDTGNIAIEIRYKNKPSGLSTTDASIWIHILEKDGKIFGGFLLPVDYLKKRAKYLLSLDLVKIVKGGDNNDSTLLLMPIEHIY
tara:strand:- start:575 stop:958 length:384 start_codon:yes stop_codon:yes gene_type:complete